MESVIPFSALILGTAIVIGCSKIAVSIDKLWETIEEIGEELTNKSN
jgi:multisubunit Na+/H+ antiporter MnhC subunit